MNYLFCVCRMGKSISGTGCSLVGRLDITLFSGPQFLLILTFSPTASEESGCNQWITKRPCAQRPRRVQIVQAVEGQRHPHRTLRWRAVFRSSAAGGGADGGGGVRLAHVVTPDSFRGGASFFCGGGLAVAGREALARNESGLTIGRGQFYPLPPSTTSGGHGFAPSGALRPIVQLVCIRTFGLGAHQISPLSSSAVTQIKLCSGP